MKQPETGSQSPERVLSESSFEPLESDPFATIGNSISRHKIDRLNIKKIIDNDVFNHRSRGFNIVRRNLIDNTHVHSIGIVHICRVTQQRHLRNQIILQPLNLIVSWEPKKHVVIRFPNLNIVGHRVEMVRDAKPLT